MPLSPGDKLGPYEILAPVGAGGMGEVYRARDLRLNRDVAIKVSQAQFSERFEREARAVAALNHPNICTLFDVGPNYLVMEYIEGKPFLPPVPQDTLVNYAAQIASALQEAHEQGIVHRDLKPSNILITSKGEAKLLDFGLARQADPVGPLGSEELTREMLTQPGVAVGTVPYMSPEQIRGSSMDGRSDLWSLGVVLYQAATGTLPFEAPTQGMVFEAILTRTPEPPRSLHPEIAPDLERIIVKLLQKDRSQRYQKAEELLAELRTVEARPSGRSRRWVYAAAAALVALGAGALLWQRMQAKPLTDKDVLILADFTNTTGDPVFDGTLREALAIQIEESPFLKVLSDDAVRADLVLMGRPPTERVTNDVARDMCLREGDKATIGGSIANLGKSYAITLASTNCNTGDVLAREQNTAPDKEHVLDAVAQAAKGMRRKLGESLGSIQKLEPPKESQVTTVSFEAFQLFAQGVIPFRSGDFTAAIPLFQRATEIDPNFATAWNYLGICYVGLTGYGGFGEYGKPVVENIARAFTLRDRVTERERFLLASAYYLYVMHDWSKSAETGDSWVRAYPRSHIAHTNSGVSHWRSGEMEEAVRELSEAYRIEPHVSFDDTNLVALYTFLGRFDEAKQIAEAELERNPGEATLHEGLLRIAEIQGDREAAPREIQWFTGKPGEYLSLQQQAFASDVRGRIHETDALLRQGNAARERRGLPPFARNAIERDALYGDCTSARQASSPSAIAVALCANAGQARAAIKQAEALSQKQPDDTLVNAIQLPMFRAAGDLKDGHPDQAVELLAPVAHYERNYPEVPYLRGLCYLADHKGPEAAAEFQKIVDHEGAFWGPFFPAAYVQLARAAALAGDTARARKAYQDLLAFWKDADPDLPLLVQARREYEPLH